MKIYRILMKILGKNSDLNKVNFKLSINKQKLMVKYRPQNRKFNNLPRTRTFIKSIQQLYKFHDHSFLVKS